MVGTCTPHRCRQRRGTAREAADAGWWWQYANAGCGTACESVQTLTQRRVTSKRRPEGDTLRLTGPACKSARDGACPDAARSAERASRRTVQRLARTTRHCAQPSYARATSDADMSMRRNELQARGIAARKAADVPLAGH